MANINLSTISLGPEGGSSAKIEEGKTLSVTANGSYTISPSEGYDAIADASVKVDITNPISVYTDTAGMKYSNSNIRVWPSSLRIAARKKDECSYMFSNTSLVGVPSFDMSKATNVANMFSSCSELQSVPEDYDTSNVSVFTGMFRECQSLTSAPALSLASATSAGSMYYHCIGLTTLDNIFDGDLPTGNVTASYMFYNCYKLKIGSDNLGEFLKHCTDCGSMFCDCTSLITLSKATLGEDWVLGASYCKSMFSGCSSLVQLPCLDVSNVTNTTYMLYNCTSLKYLHRGGFKNLKVSLDLHYCTSLEHDSIVDLFNAISTVTGQTLTLGSTNLAKLTDEEKAIATNKGWTLK